MKKNLAIAILAVVSALSLSFGFYQKHRADKFEKEINEREIDEKEISENLHDAYLDFKQTEENREKASSNDSIKVYNQQEQNTENRN